MTRLRVATYDIDGTVARDRRRDVGRIVRVVAELGADVVALQGVETARGSHDPLTLLERETDLRTVAGPTLFREGADYSIALMTRGRLVEVRRFDLSVERREPRGALDVLLDCRGVRLRVLATHLGLRPTRDKGNAVPCPEDGLAVQVHDDIPLGPGDVVFTTT